MLNGPTLDDIEKTINDRLAEGGLDTAPVVSVSERAPREPVSVQVTVDFSFLTMMDAFAEIFAIEDVSATSVMIAER
ncbi:hypothetical protein [Desulfohalovibrio reitneri]|uniref:hypothetical protein n=1 Tax=Desulfohalovibrio reitneri TaxID=1307759 RepID=UPI0004A6CEF6|nr:hypothetical protein [Desulfohalovibrio reitneri]